MPKFYLAALPFLLGASNAFACAVCGAGQDASSAAFVKGTALLSLMPLGMLGGIGYYIYRHLKAGDEIRREPAARETDAAAKLTLVPKP